jgi:hypothetical protein
MGVKTLGHTRFSAGSTIIMFGFSFSIHTGQSIQSMQRLRRTKAPRAALYQVIELRSFAQLLQLSFPSVWDAVTARVGPPFSTMVFSYYLWLQDIN